MTAPRTTLTAPVAVPTPTEPQTSIWDKASIWDAAETSIWDKASIWDGDGGKKPPPDIWGSAGSHEPPRRTPRDRRADGRPRAHRHIIIVPSRPRTTPGLLALPVSILADVTEMEDAEIMLGEDLDFTEYAHLEAFRACDCGEWTVESGFTSSTGEEGHDHWLYAVQLNQDEAPTILGDGMCGCEEEGCPFDLLNGAQFMTFSRADFSEINPKGYADLKGTFTCAEIKIHPAVGDTPGWEEAMMRRI